MLRQLRRAPQAGLESIGTQALPWNPSNPTGCYAFKARVAPTKLGEVSLMSGCSNKDCARGIETSLRQLLQQLSI